MPIQKHIILVFIGLISFFLLTACKKNKSSCYDRALEKKANKSACLTDCPGVTGCDGKFYCNECEANIKGIKIK